ncbi:hypothetical protein BH09PLA1_BH09PLA1_35690 [soil metagenome]
MADIFNYESVKDAYTVMKQTSDPQMRGQFTTMFVMWTIAHIVYYIMAGFAVILLGRRLIQASFAAFKEARRERA